jgi:hypothetical protein
MKNRRNFKKIGQMLAKFGLPYYTIENIFGKVEPKRKSLKLILSSIFFSIQNCKIDVSLFYASLFLLPKKTHQKRTSYGRKKQFKIEWLIVRYNAHNLDHVIEILGRFLAY